MRTDPIEQETMEEEHEDDDHEYLEEEYEDSDHEHLLEQQIMEEEEGSNATASPPRRSRPMTLII